jgi:hypothetical protein
MGVLAAEILQGRDAIPLPSTEAHLYQPLDAFRVRRLTQQPPLGVSFFTHSSPSLGRSWKRSHACIREGAQVCHRIPDFCPKSGLAGVRIMKE